MLRRLRLFSSTFLLLPLLLSGQALAIEKCQDAEGKWHYGDNAAAVCADSKITVLDKTGVKIKEIDRPPSHDEIEAREAEKRRKATLAAEEKERAIARQRILRVYPDEASILRARNQRIDGLEKNIVLNEQLLDELRLRKKKLDSTPDPKSEKAQARLAGQKQQVQEDIDRYTASISSLREDRERVQRKYDIILEEYRDLTGTGPAKAAGAE